MKRMLVTYTATVAINLPDGVELDANMLKKFTADEVAEFKVMDSHDVVDRDYAVYYNPKTHELLQLTHHILRPVLSRTSTKSSMKKSRSWPPRVSCRSSTRNTAAI